MLKLGYEVAQSTVAKYMAKHPLGPGQSWKTFLRNHAAGIGAMDLLVVPTIGFRLLFVLVILRLERRRLLSVGVTDHPTAEWIAQQITEAFPWDEAPDHLIRDRDTAYGPVVTHRLIAMGIRDHPIAPRSPWQNGYAERLIGSIRRECLDHIVVWGDVYLRRVLAACQLLQPSPAASLIGRGCTEPSAGSALWFDHHYPDPRRLTSPILPDVVFGRDNWSTSNGASACRCCPGPRCVDIGRTRMS
jgi:transposase InsO family protein